VLAGSAQALAAACYSRGGLSQQASCSLAPPDAQRDYNLSFEPCYLPWGAVLQVGLVLQVRPAGGPEPLSYLILDSGGR